MDANVPTGTVIGLFEEPDDEGCIVDYGIDDANLQVCPPTPRKVSMAFSFFRQRRQQQRGQRHEHGLKALLIDVCYGIGSLRVVCA